MQEIGVGIVGIGIVGAGVAQILSANAGEIERRLGARLRLVRSDDQNQRMRLGRRRRRPLP